MTKAATMNTIFVTLIVLIFLLLLTGLIKPHISLFWYPGIRTRIKSFLIYFSILFILVCTFGSTLPTPIPISKGKSSEKSITGNIKAITTVDVQDSLKFYQDKWEKIQLVNEDGLPQYVTYYNQLDSVISELKSLKENNIKAAKSINALRLKLLNSRKFKKAHSQRDKYGNASFADLYAACETTFDIILKNPSSLNVIRKNVEQSSSGWIVVYLYRATNSFGANVIQTTTFTVRYNESEDGYYIYKYK